MYIYQSGIIGEAVRTKIADAKNSVMNGAGRTDTQSFGDLLRSLMFNTNEQTKAVGVTNVSDSTSPIASADGRTLLYALTNADTDSAASAVVGALGLPISDTGIKAAADSLSSAINVLESADSADKESLIPILGNFVDKYNALVSDLRAQSTASGIMYSRLFSTAAGTAADALAEAGITVDDTGRLTLDADKLSSVGLDGFLGSIAAAANAVSTYASSITGSSSSSLLDFLGNDDSDSTYSTSNYYSSLINSMI
ncbi:MAG: hypothetical protein IK990_09065 [Ruminiclostridium sp.]|nr:hypothetical protein [Ruminiclostridium sp.]